MDPRAARATRALGPGRTAEGDGRMTTGAHAVILNEATAARLRAWAAGWPELAAARALAGARPVHLVGGAVRDLLLGRAPKDADLVLPGDVAELAPRLARRLDAARVALHDDPPTERLVLRAGRTLDLAAYRGPDLAADLRARDLTVNALAVDLAILLGDGPLVVLDPTGGRADLERGRLRAAGPDAFRADPLRILRAYRLVTAFGWRIEPDTVALILAARPGLTAVARERVAAELIAILASERAWPVVRAMTEAGVLGAALPPLPAATDRPWRTLRRLAWARRRLSAGAGEGRSERLARLLTHEFAPARPRAALLAWLALAYDAAVLPPPRAGSPLHGTGRRLPGTAGFAGLVRTLAGSLRAGRREAAEAAAVARALAAGDLLALPPGAAESRVVLAELGEAAPGALLLAWAAWSPPATGQASPATTPPPDGRRARLRALLDLWWEVVQPAVQAPALLDGATAMQTLGLAPGPALGSLLRAVRMAQIRGEIGTPEEALALARRLQERD